MEPRTDQPLQPGTVLGGRYEIVATGDDGAFGTLYRAKTRADGLMVTIQVLDSRLFGDQRVRAAVRRELEALAGLEHKNLALPLSFADEMLPSGTRTYLVYEHLDGQSLAVMHEKKVAAGKPFSLKGAYNVVAHLANGLQALHSTVSQGGANAHGGLSMRSVHVTSQGRVKVLELGLARALVTAGERGAVAQLVPTLAPEVLARPEQIDARTDVFGTGAIMYELLAGQPPTIPPTPPSTFVAGVPRAIDLFLDQCLRAERGDRFAEMSRVKESLQNAVGPEIAPTAVASASQPVLSSAPAPAKAAAAPPPRPAAGPPPRPPGSSSAPALPAVARPPSGPGAVPSLPPSPGLGQPAGQPRGSAPIPKSFNVDSALSSVDESHERWLIQKDKLDFGPFNLRDIREQIESGKIVGEHNIVDTESGERRRVKDHPQLRELMLQAEATHAENARVQQESSERSRHRGRVVTLLGIIALVVLGGGAGLFWYVQHMKAKVVVVKEQVESDLKFEISMKVDPPEKKKTPGPRKTHKNAAGQNVFDDTTTLGDASEGGGDETLDGATVQRVMNSNFKVLVGCIKEERGRNSSLRTVDMDFIIKGSGNVSAVKVNGQTAGAFASCMYGKMQTVAFPKFNGAKTHASFSLSFK